MKSKNIDTLIEKWDRKDKEEKDKIRIDLSAKWLSCLPEHIETAPCDYESFCIKVIRQQFLDNAKKAGLME